MKCADPRSNLIICAGSETPSAFFAASSSFTSCAAVHDRSFEGCHGLRCLVVRDWEVIATNLSRERWSWGCIVSMDSEGRDIFVV